MTVDPDALEATLRRLVSQDQDATDDLVTQLQQVVQACVDLFAVTGSGIMLADEGNDMRYVAASDGQGRLLEILEAQTMQGPCTEAFVLDEVVGVTDIRDADHWPDLQAAVVDAPELRAVLGVPVKLGGVVVGTLDVFRDHAHEWTPEERTAVARYGEVITIHLATALAARRAGEQAEQLQYALDYRVVIERGVGYLMGRDGLDAVTAFNRLRVAARSTRTKVGTVAQQLLDTGELPARP